MKRNCGKRLGLGGGGVAGWDECGRGAEVGGRLRGGCGGIVLWKFWMGTRLIRIEARAEEEKIEHPDQIGVGARHYG